MREWIVAAAVTMVGFGVLFGIVTLLGLALNGRLDWLVGLSAVMLLTLGRTMLWLDQMRWFTWVGQRLMKFFDRRDQV